MRGKWVYYAIAAFLAIILAFQTNVFGVIGLLLLITSFLFFKRFSKFQMLVILLVFLGFYFRAKIEISNNHSVFQGNETQFTVEFNHPVSIDGNVLSGYATDTSGEKIAIKYILQSEHEKAYFSKHQLLGYTYKIKGSLRKAPAQTNPNAFDYKRYLEHQKVHWQLVVKQWGAYKERYGPILLIKKQRQEVISLLQDELPTSVSSLISALLFGERQILDPSLEKAYQSLGIIHLLAISGANVALYVSIIHYLGIRIGITRERILIVLLLYLPIFVFVSGATPSVIRAAMMMFLFLLFKLLSNLKLSGLDSCSMVLLLNIGISPYLIYDVGFQLSFSVTFALILSTNLLLSTSASPLTILMKSSIISQICALPIVLYHFYEFSLFSFFANLLYIPLFSVVITPLCIGFFFLFLILGERGLFLISAIQSGFELINQFTVFIGRVPFQMVTIGRPPISIILILLGTIFYFFYKWERNRKTKKMLIYALPLFFALTMCYGLSHYSVTGQITFVDVGQGDSIVIQNGFKKKTYVIDTGGTVSFEKKEWEKQSDPFEVGKDVLIPYLKGKGVSTIDKLILTHGDMDHIGGARAVLETMKVRELVLPSISNRSSLEYELIQIAREKNTKIVYVKDGMNWDANGVTFHILNPIIEHEERNDNSVVIHVNIGGLYWLFTGDLEEQGEEVLLREYPTLPVDVLKIGHHGSKSSTSAKLLQAYNPKVAVISVGRTNRFGHPHQDVLERLRENHMKIFRTDTNGAITYTFRKERGTFLPHIP